MLSSINPWLIVRDHFATYYTIVKSDDETLPRLDDGLVKVVDKKSQILFVLIPGVVAAVTLWQVGCFGKVFADTLATAYSIFAALLLNLQILVAQSLEQVDSILGNRPYHRQLRTKYRFLKDVIATTSFAVLLSILLVVFVLLSYMPIVYTSIPKSFQWCFAYLECYIVYYLTTMFMMTLIVVLRRVHILLMKTYLDLPQIPEGK